MPKFSLLIALTLSDFVTENQNIYTQEIICMNSLFIVHLLPHLKRVHDVISKFFKTNWLFKAKWTIFQPYHGENKLIFNEMMMRSTLY